MSSIAEAQESCRGHHTQKGESRAEYLLPPRLIPIQSPKARGRVTGSEYRTALTESGAWHDGLGGQRTMGMDIGLMMDSDYHEGQTQRQAFDAVLTTADQAETLGFDGIWLAERHFSPRALPGPVHRLAPCCWPRQSPCNEPIRIGTAVFLLPWGTRCAWRKRSPHSII